MSPIQLIGWLERVASDIDRFVPPDPLIPLTVELGALPLTNAEYGSYHSGSDRPARKLQSFDQILCPALELPREVHTASVQSGLERCKWSYRNRC